MFSRKWFVATLLVIAGTLVLIRLGIWQLDRFEARQEANAHYVEMESMPPLDLNVEIPASLHEMEYRAVAVTGEYDFENQIAVRNQIRSSPWSRCCIRCTRCGRRARTR